MHIARIPAILALTVAVSGCFIPVHDHDRRDDRRGFRDDHRRDDDRHCWREGHDWVCRD